MAAGGSIIAIIAWIGLGLILTGIAWGLSRWLGTMAATRETQRGEGCSSGQRPEQDTSLTHVAQSSSR